MASWDPRREDLIQTKIAVAERPPAWIFAAAGQGLTTMNVGTARVQMWRTPDLQTCIRRDEVTLWSPNASLN
jgi:hypothetical protein